MLRAIRDNPLRAAAVGHNIHGYKLTAFVIAAAYAGFAGGLLGVMQGFMPPDAFMFDTSGQLVMQTAIGGAGTLFGPLVGAAVWLYLSDFLQTTLHLGATWKLVLGVVFVLLVCFLRRGIDRRHRRTSAACHRPGGKASRPSTRRSRSRASAAKGGPGPPIAHARSPLRRRRATTGAAVRSSSEGSDQALRRPRRQQRHRFLGHGAASCAASSVRTAPARRTFFKMLTCEVPPTAGRIVFEDRDITGIDVTDVCQLGLTKSYQVNQLFTRLTVRENMTIAALAEKRGTVPSRDRMARWKGPTYRSCLEAHLALNGSGFEECPL